MYPCRPWWITDLWADLIIEWETRGSPETHIKQYGSSTLSCMFSYNLLQIVIFISKYHILTSFLQIMIAKHNVLTSCYFNSAGKFQQLTAIPHICLTTQLHIGLSDEMLCYGCLYHDTISNSLTPLSLSNDLLLICCWRSLSSVC